MLEILRILANYTLLSTSIDVKGRTFEIFLGRTFTGSLGQFFTPRTIVKFMVEFCLPYLKTFTKDKICKIIDPSCGSGGFLIDTFQYLYTENKDDALYLDKLRKESIYGVDINPRLARTAKMNMILHGDGYSGITQGSGLEIKNSSDKYDLVITNPPFGAKDKDEKLLSQFELGKHTLKGKNKEQLREILFIEKCITITKTGGKIAILLPDGILNNKKLQYVRDFILEKTILEAVISLPDRTFKASGANSKCSILFLKKKSYESEQQDIIYMGIAETIGFETRTKKAMEINDNDLPKIYENFKLAKSSLYDILRNDRDKQHLIISTNPSCFIIKKECLEKRIDSSFYYAKHIHKLDKPHCKINAVANIVTDKKDLKKYPNQEFSYIAFSNVDTKLGSITNAQTVLGETAPDRAKCVVKAGDVICAGVKDSEENIAIIPESMDNFIVSTGFIVFRAIPPMTPEALYVLLKQKNNLLQVRNKVSGTIMPNISGIDYSENIIPLLSEEEIKEITSEIKTIEKYREHIRTQLSTIIGKY